jgi:hypothetical protein
MDTSNTFTGGELAPNWYIAGSLGPGFTLLESSKSQEVRERGALSAEDNRMSKAGPPASSEQVAIRRE